MSTRVTLHFQPTLVFTGDEDHDKTRAVSTAIEMFLLDNRETLGLETFIVSAPTRDTIQDGVCRVGDHPFVAPLHFPSDRTLPDICPQHSEMEWMQSWEDAFLPQLVALRDFASQDDSPLADLCYQPDGIGIWNTGGNCMCIGIALNGLSAPDADSHWHLLVGDAEDGPLSKDEESRTTTFSIGLYDGEGNGYQFPNPAEHTDVIQAVRLALEQVPTVMADKARYAQ